MVADNHEDVVALTKDMRGFLDATKEVELCSEVHSSLCNIARLCEEKGGDIKESIRAWARAVHEEEERASSYEPEDAHNQRLRSIEEEQAFAWENIGSIGHERRALERFRQELRDKQELLARKNAEIETSARKEMPRIVHELSLQAHISGIAWDYANSHRAKGCMTNPRAGQAELFDFDPDERPTFDITNTLWKLMG